VLPLWCDRLKIVLTPEHVTVVRLSAGLKPREVFNKTMLCTAAKQDEAAWQPALRVMRQLLRQAGTAKANAEIIISNHFVRYQLVKAQADLGSTEEEQGFVRFSFTEVYGGEAAKWSMRWGSGLDLAPQVASAIDQSLLDSIANIFAEASIKLISFQPYLMAAFNFVCQSIDAKPVLFVLVEHGRLCIALLKDGDWKSLNSIKLGSDWAGELPNMIERELQRIGSEGSMSNILLCLPDFFDHKRLSMENQSVRILTMSPEALQKRTVLSVASVEAK
jgi:hypothetical protein